MGYEHDGNLEPSFIDKNESVLVSTLHYSESTLNYENRSTTFVNSETHLDNPLY